MYPLTSSFSPTPNTIFDNFKDIERSVKLFIVNEI